MFVRAIIGECYAPRRVSGEFHMLARGFLCVTNLGTRLTVMGIVLSIIGVMMIMAGLIIDSLSGGGGGMVSFGAAVVIGLIPLVFGSDKASLLIGIAGAIILLVIALAALHRGRKNGYQAGDIPT